MLLVSRSPRRQQIMTMAGFDFEVVPADIEETYPDDLEIEKIPEYLAEQKVLSIADSYENEVLIAADTIVVVEGKALGKPKDDIEAVEMLKMLSGKPHKVISGGCVLFNENMIGFSDETTVYFRTLEEDEILYYVENFSPLDKAGAYGIQEWIGLVGIEKIEGSFYNVMGLPIHKVYKAIMVLAGR